MSWNHVIKYQIIINNNAWVQCNTCHLYPLIYIIKHADLHVPYRAFYLCSGGSNVLIYKLTPCNSIIPISPFVSHLAKTLRRQSRITQKKLCTVGSPETWYLLRVWLNYTKDHFQLPSFPEFLPQHRNSIHITHHEWCTINLISYSTYITNEQHSNNNSQSQLCEHSNQAMIHI